MERGKIAKISAILSDQRKYHGVHNDYSQLSDFWELIRVTVADTVTVTVIIFPVINYMTVTSRYSYDIAVEASP